MSRFSSGGIAADFAFRGRIEKDCFIKELRPSDSLSLRQMTTQLGPNPRQAIETYVQTLERAGVPVAEIIDLDFEREPPRLVQRKVEHPTLAEVLLAEFQSLEPVSIRSITLLSRVLQFITAAAYVDSDIRIDTSATNFAVTDKPRSLILLDVVPPWRLSMRNRAETNAEVVLGSLTFEWSEQISDLLCEWLRPLIYLEYPTVRLKNVLSELLPLLEAKLHRTIAALVPFGAAVPQVCFESFDVWAENRASRRFNLFSVFMAGEISRTELFDIFCATSTKYVI